MFMSEAIRKLEDYRNEALAKLGDLDSNSTNGAGLTEAEAQLRQIKDLTVELTGKKSRITELKKEIGKVDAATRAEFAQAVQALDKDIREALESAESRLNERITTLKTEREAVDVTIP